MGNRYKTAYEDRDILEEIASLCDEDGGTITFDTWGHQSRNRYYVWLRETFRSKYNYFRVQSGGYSVLFKGATNGVGVSMGTPDTMTVRKLNEYKPFDYETTG